MEQDLAVVAADSAVVLVDEFVRGVELYREALSFAVQYDHPVYDAMYAILARRNAGELVTVDDRLKKLARRAKVGVVKLKA